MNRKIYNPWWKGRLRWQCVICGKEIERPILGEYTCRDKQCEQRYRRFSEWRWKENQKLKLNSLMENNHKNILQSAAYTAKDI